MAFAVCQTSDFAYHCGKESHEFMPLGLIFLFFTTALLYASVGFGGGSTYNALLVLSGADYRILPTIALTCNIIVVAGGALAFARAGHLQLHRLAPWVIASVPAAWAGGRIPVSETVFIGVLGFSLLAAGLHLIFDRRTQTEQPPTTLPLIATVCASAVMGFVSGLVGIGGGIFLAPVLYLLRWGPPREIAGACSVFILINSIAGLAGQLTKLGDAQALALIDGYWLLFPAVLIGGQIGSQLANKKLNPTIIKRLTAVLILYVSIRLLWRWLALVF